MSKGLDAALIAANQEQSVYPVFLVVIEFTAGTVRFAAHDANVTFPTGGDLYTARGMMLDDINYDSELSIPTVTLHVDNTDEIMSGYIDANETTLKGTPVSIYRIDGGLLGSSNYKDLLFGGEIVGATVNQSQVAFEIESAFNVLDDVGPEVMYTPECIHIFGGAECGYSITGTDLIADTAAPSYTVIRDQSDLAQADNYWAGGIVIITSGAASGQQREILSSSQSAKTVTVDYPFSALVSNNDRFTIYPGCRKTTADCEKWSNIANFTGFPCIPGLVVGS